MNDILGYAMTDYYQGRFTGKLWVHNKYGPREEMPVQIYFRDMAAMPELEWIALQQCRGKILDIGAGAGSHALALQQLGQDITALDISPLLATLMGNRGVKKVVCGDFFELSDGTAGPGSGGTKASDTYDTLLLLMNGLGLAGTLDGLDRFLQMAQKLLRPGGQLLFDSSDIAYLYKGRPPKGPVYYGELFYQYEYKRQRSDWFQWLFIDRKTFTTIAAKAGWETEILSEDGHDQYLARCRYR
jgi:SAM-dependent methyltransferase